MVGQIKWMIEAEVESVAVDLDQESFVVAKLYCEDSKEFVDIRIPRSSAGCLAVGEAVSIVLKSGQPKLDECELTKNQEKIANG